MTFNKKVLALSVAACITISFYSASTIAADKSATKAETKKDKKQKTIAEITKDHTQHDGLFKLFQNKYPQFNLLMEDDKHPNPNGSYLASCIIFSHLSAESSLNLSKRYKGIDNKGVEIYYSIVEDEVLTFLQQISDEVIF